MQLHERRSSRRFPVQLPIVIASSGVAREIQGVVHNMSVSGFFFSADNWPQGFVNVLFKMIFPSEITGTESVRVRGQGTILRIEDGGRMIGIAATIDSYELG
jgi:hypothetical protein